MVLKRKQRKTRYSRPCEPVQVAIIANPTETQLLEKIAAELDSRGYSAARINRKPDQIADKQAIYYAVTPGRLPEKAMLREYHAIKRELTGKKPHPNYYKGLI